MRNDLYVLIGKARFQNSGLSAVTDEKNFYNSHLFKVGYMVTFFDAGNIWNEVF